MANQQPIDNQQADARLVYKDILQTLRTKYNPHYNLYQKQQLEEKVKCYQTNPSQPEAYYDCIQLIDENMIKNSQALQLRFNTIEITSKECQSACQQSFKDDQSKRNQCGLKCLETMKTQCLSLQDQFYEVMLKNNQEFKKIKK